MRVLFLLASIAPVWLLCGIIATGFYWANDKVKYPRLECSRFFAAHDFHEELSINLVAGPIALANAPFDTGLFEHGWSIDHSVTPGNVCKKESQ